MTNGNRVRGDRERGKGELKRRKRVRTQFSSFLLTWKNNRIWAKWYNGVINNFLTNRQKQRGTFLLTLVQGPWRRQPFLLFLPTRLQEKVFSYRLELSDSSVKAVKFQRIANPQNHVDRNCKLIGKCTPKMKPWNCCLSSRSLQGAWGMWDNWEMVTLAIKDAEAKFSNWRIENLSPSPLGHLFRLSHGELDFWICFMAPSLPFKKNMWLVIKQEYKTCYEKKKFLMKIESKLNWSTKDGVKTKDSVEAESGAWDPPSTLILAVDTFAQININMTKYFKSLIMTCLCTNPDFIKWQRLWQANLLWQCTL